MKSIFTVLQDIEKLIYKVLMWIILIPKTVVRIVWEPRWAAEYIRAELKDGGSQFDEYVSPVILLLVVALLPSLGYNALPKFGVTLSSPAEAAPITDRNLSFDATVDYVSTSDKLEYFVAWEVWKENSNGEFEFENSAYHSGSDEGSTIVKVDQNTIRDGFRYDFTPGHYLVYASAGNADTRREDVPTLETYEAYLNVQVPDDPSEQVKVFSDTTKTLDEKTTGSTKNFLDRAKEEQTIFLALALMTPPLLFAFASQLAKVRKVEKIGEETLRESFYVQCYYFSPLSVAIWATYYAYYFFTVNAYGYLRLNAALQILLLPLVWAALWFVRTEVKRIAWELEVGWQETPKKGKKSEADSASDEKKDTAPSESEAEPDLNVVVSKKNTFVSTAIVLVCIIVLVFGGRLLVDFKTYMDDVRLNAIRAFPILAFLLILGFVVSWYKRRKERKDFFGWNIVGLVGLTLAFMVVMNRISGVVGFTAQPMVVAEAQATEVWSPPATVEVVQARPTGQALPTATLQVVQPEATATLVTLASDTPAPGATQPPALDTPTPVLVEPTPTAEPPPALALSQYYSQEFDTPDELADWFSYMTFGDSRMIRQTVGLGKLSVSIRPLEDKYAWYYLVNNKFTYLNVKVETVVVNQGNNANGVSLICRYSEAGWYEFVLSNDGTYVIYAVDQLGTVSQGYNELANGGSARIRTGRQTNTFTAICSNNELILMVNDTEVRRITENRFGFADGRIGLAVSSMHKLPVSVEFESLKISEP